MVVYGIDLGTCNSCIARNDGAGSGTPVELLDALGRKFIPSVVSFDPKTGQPKIGYPAKAFLRTRPECTIAYAKREMDKEFCDHMVSVAGTQRQISPVEASACILKHLFDGANKVEVGAGRERVRKAVITVPAKFDESQRTRTKKAAEMAGIEVLGLIQEPTAAAIAYDIPSGSTVLVFDLGGGTLDVSIVQNDRGNYNVIGYPAGDDHLGGLDWDEKLAELIFQKIGKRPDKSNKEWNRIKVKAELLKEALTTWDEIVDTGVDNATINEDGPEIHIERSEFETKSQSLLDRCFAVVDQAIDNARRESPNLKIDFFLTVGGSSRMQMIKKGLADRYGEQYGKGKAVDDWLRITEPETAIARGAAKYAQMLVRDNSVAKIAKTNFRTIQDKSPHSYGIIVRDGNKEVIRNIIKSSDPINYQGKTEGTLTEDGGNFELPIYVDAKDGDPVNPDIRVIPPIKIPIYKKKGTPITIITTRNQDGIIKITVKCEDICETYDAIRPISDDTERIIEHSLSLM